MNNWTAALVSALLGLIVSPYLHVLIARSPMHLPLRRIDLHCSNCGSALQRGQGNALLARLKRRHLCVNCNQSLWPDSPWVEIATTLVFALLGARLGWGWALSAYWIFFFAAIVIVVVDYRHYIIPTKIVYPTVLAGLIIFFVSSILNGNGFGKLGDAVLAMILCWIFYYVTHLFSRGGMGFGDVRLSLMVGLFAGWIGFANAFWAILLGLFLGAGIGLLLVVVRIRKLKSHIPFGPFMIIGASLAILFGSVVSG